MPLFLVSVQKPVIGKPKPSEADRLRHRRVYIVEAKSTLDAEKVFLASGEPVQSGIVRTDPLNKRVVLLHP